MKRQRFISVFLSVLFLAALLTGTLTGCRTKPNTVQDEKTKISLWFYWDQVSSRKELKRLVEDFNQSQNRIEVEAQYVPDEDFKKRLALSMADDTMPDLALVNSADFRYFHAMRPFVELTEIVDDADGYLPQVAECCTVDDKLYGLPVRFHCPVLYCNVELLQQYDVAVPKTWDELCQAAEKMTDSGHYGFAVPAIDSEDSVYNFLPLLWSCGGDVDRLDSEESFRAFHILRRLEESGAMSRQAINLTSGDLVAQFVEGNIAMMVNSSSMVHSIQELSPRMKFEVESLPVYEENEESVSVIGGEVFGVTQGEHQVEAMEFLEYISNGERMEQYIGDAGFMVPRQDVWGQNFTNDVKKEKVLEIAQHSRTREFSVEWPLISDVLTEAIEAEIIGEKDEREILEEAAAKVKAIREEGL